MNVRLNPKTGLLPEGVHDLSWTDIAVLFGTSVHRRNLLKYFHEVCSILKKAGVDKVWLNGSFVTSKSRPSDYDCSYELTQRIFDALPTDPFKLKNADTIIRARFNGDVKAEPMPDGYIYHSDLFPNVIGHTHRGVAIENTRKGIVVLHLSNLPATFSEGD